MTTAESSIGIVVSRADFASEHIGEELLERREWTGRSDDHYVWTDFELRIYDDLHLDLEHVASDFDNPDLLVFVSRHSGETGSLLSAHFTGNIAAAEFGGHDHSLAHACPSAQKTVLGALEDHAPEEYDVSLECTHHGPSDPGAPSMFVELGSGEEQWTDPKGAEAVANAVLELGDVVPKSDRTVVSFGGSHYAPRPTRVVRETDWACGHVAADWALDDLGIPSHHSDVVDQVFTKSRADYAIIEGDRQELADTIEELGYRIVSERWLHETDGVPLDLVERLESELATVEDGLRFGANASDTTEYTIRDLPEKLLATANGIDMAQITNAARTTSVAYETRENGNRVSGRAAFHSESEYDTFIEAVCDVLEAKYDVVECGGSEVVVHESAFDPDLARELGVPEGPKFGALSNGESVEIDGRTVTPSEVTVDRTRRYPR